MRKNYIVVGSGLPGALISRILVTSGNNVVIFERRSHIGGNLYDYLKDIISDRSIEYKGALESI